MPPIVPRIAALAGVLLLATATITFAAQGPPAATPPTAAPVKAPPRELVVPDVRRQAYVFAKGMLEEQGFAWRVQGTVQGFAANQVVAQHPSPGTRVVDTGAPLVTLSLARNTAYAEDGRPDNASNYRGTRLVLAGAAALRTPVAKPKPVAKPTPAAKKRPAAAAAKKPKRAAVLPQKRPPAFVVPGAPREPLDEMPLPDRARALDAWLTKHPKISPANVDHWLYQHSWIVTGARFGWWRGAEALRILVRVDERVQQLWGVGNLSRDLARQSLAEVEARAR